MRRRSNPPDTDFIDRLTALGREVDAYRASANLSPAGWEGMFNRLANEMVELLQPVGPKALYLYSKRLLGDKQHQRELVHWIGWSSPSSAHLTRVEDWFTEPYQEILAAYDIALVTNKMKKKRASPYLEQVLAWIANGSIRLPEDIDSSYEILKEYHDLKAAGRLNKNEQDISQYRYQQDLAQMVMKKTGRGKRLNTKAVKQIDELVGDFEVARLYQIDTYQQMRAVGSNTNWCVMANENYFDGYRPPFYLLTVEDEGGERRVALIHLPTLSIKNEPDIPTGEEIRDGEFGEATAELLERLFKQAGLQWAIDKDLGDLGNKGDWSELENLADELEKFEDLDGNAIYSHFEDYFQSAIENAYDPSLEHEDLITVLEQALQDTLDHDLGIEGAVDVSDEGYYYGQLPPWSVSIDDFSVFEHIGAGSDYATFEKAYTKWDQSDDEAVRIKALKPIYGSLSKIAKQYERSSDDVLNVLDTGLDDLINNLLDP
jgi:hypothetical protein